PKPESSEPLNSVGHIAGLAAPKPRPNARRRIDINRIAPTLIPVVQFCKSALVRVPLTLTTVRTAITETATILFIAIDIGIICDSIVLKATASVATVPPFIAKNRVQPNRNAGSGPKQTRR